MSLLGEYVDNYVLEPWGSKIKYKKQNIKNKIKTWFQSMAANELVIPTGAL